MGLILTAIFRATQLQRLYKTAPVQRARTYLKSWYDSAPRKMQLAAASAVLVVLAWVLFA